MGATSRISPMAYRVDETEGDLVAKQRAVEFLGYVQRLHRRDRDAVAQEMLARLHRGKVVQPLLGQQLVCPRRGIDISPTRTGATMALSKIARALNSENGISRKIVLRCASAPNVCWRGNRFPIRPQAARLSGDEWCLFRLWSSFHDVI